MIVVTTPTGQIGSELVRRLLGQDADLRVVVRDASRLDGPVRERVEVVEGTHEDPAVLDRALPGADALFWVTPPNPAAPSAEAWYVGLARVGAAAVARHGVGHVVGLSSAGYGWPTPAGMLSAAFAADAEWAKGSAAHRGISPPFFLENLLGQVDAIRTQGVFSLTCAGDRPLPSIATADVADAAADALTDLSWSGHRDVPVFGPDRLTPDEMAAVIGEELGRPVAYRRLTLDDFASILRSRGASEQLVADMTTMFAAQDAGIYDRDWAAGKVTGTDFRTWCRQVLRPAGLAAAA